MKKILIWTVLLASVILTGCNDDVTIPGNISGSYSDGDVVFTLSNRGQQTRTMYQDEWDNTKTQQIYWGNYISSEEEIKIFCKADTETGYTYTVTPQAENNNTAAAINPKQTGAALKWVGNGITHNFYAFYPAKHAGDMLIDGSKSKINAQLSVDQRPEMYKRKIGTGTIAATTIEEITANTAKGTANSTTIYAEPNMENAIMVAKTEVDSKGFGETVNLDFHVLADVLDFTINGPVKPNSLGGNVGDEGAEREFINIQSIEILPVDEKDNTPIVGSFDMDMETYEVTNVSGDNSIMIQFPSPGITLHVRQENDKEGVPAVDEIDHLRLRAFMIPGQITNLKQLKIIIATNYGTYEKSLVDDDMVRGEIHPVRFGYFKTRGTEFDYSAWMGQLDPNIYISELSIPGAWHAANPNYQGANPDMQAMYKEGIRAFEVATTSGTIPMKYGQLGTPIEDWTDPSIYQEPTITSDNITTGDPTDLSDVKRTPSSPGLNGYNYTATATVTQTRTIRYRAYPKFSLRLYRTNNVTATTPNPDASLSDAIISTASLMNSNAFMVLEFGLQGARSVNAKYKEYSVTQTRSKSNVSISGTGWNENRITWNNLDALFTDDDAWGNEVTSSSTYTTYTIGSGEAWVIAVESCINNIKKKINPQTHKSLIYPNEITPNTTLGDVAGTVVVKVNTNDPSEGVSNESGWTADTPALFSRWLEGSGTSPLTINLQWGGPVAPYSTPETTLRYCFTELEKITNFDSRKACIDLINEKAYENYSNGTHNTFYNCSIGGFYNDNSEENCKLVATTLNPYLLQQITKPDRKLCPMGFVFMNYVISPENGQDNDSYRSGELIRAIINNNAAFRMARRGASNKKVGDNTNSYFNNNNNNPFKD